MAQREMKRKKMKECIETDGKANTWDSAEISLRKIYSNKCLH